MSDHMKSEVLALDPLPCAEGLHIGSDQDDLGIFCSKAPSLELLCPSFTTDQKDTAADGGGDEEEQPSPNSDQFNGVNKEIPVHDEKRGAQVKHEPVWTPCRESVRHTRRNSCGSSTSDALKGNLQEKLDGEVNTENGSDLQDFLDTYYNQNRKTDAGADLVPAKKKIITQMVTRAPCGSFQFAFHRNQQRKHIIKKKSSNPLRGALAAAMEASSNHKMQQSNNNNNNAVSCDGRESVVAGSGSGSGGQLYTCDHNAANSPRNVIDVTKLDNGVDANCHQQVYQQQVVTGRVMNYEEMQQYKMDSSAFKQGSGCGSLYYPVHSSGMVFSRESDFTYQDSAYPPYHLGDTPADPNDMRLWGDLQSAFPFDDGLGDQVVKAHTTKHRGPRGSSSSYRGVTQHRRTGRWEAHVWDQGKQVYLGGFETEERAGRAYDVVALKCRGIKAETNFPMAQYNQIVPYLQSVTRDELVALLRRRSKGFSRGSSKYTGVTKHKCGKWEARISNKENVHGRKYTYLGLYETEVSAATAHDKAAVALYGFHAHTNFEISNYSDELQLHNPGTKEMGMLKLFQGIAQDVLS